jgi:hypothetical protein
MKSMIVLHLRDSKQSPLRKIASKPFLDSTMSYTISALAEVAFVKSK